MSGGRPRAIAPLWARLVLACAPATLAQRAKLFWPERWLETTDALLASLAAAAVLAAVASLTRPDVRLRSTALLVAAAVLPLALGWWQGSPITAAAWMTLSAGAAFASFARPGDAPAPPGIPRRAARRATLAIGGGAVTAVAVALSLEAGWLVYPLLARFVASGLAITLLCAAPCVGFLLGLDLGARAARRMRLSVAVALLLASYAALGLRRGSLETHADVRLDTGEMRTYYVGLPFPLEDPHAPEPYRSMLHDAALAEGVPEQWRRCRPPREEVAQCYAAARRWLTADRRIAGLLVEEIAEWVAGVGSIMEGGPLLGASAPPGQWWENESVIHFCGWHGYELAYQPTGGEEWALDTLLQGLSARSEEDRLEATRRLGRLKAIGAELALVRALGDRSPDVRSAAVRALAALGNPALIPALLEARARQVQRFQAAVNSGAWKQEEECLRWLDMTIAQLRRREALRR